MVYRKVLLCSMSVLMMHISLHSGFAISEPLDGDLSASAHTLSWQMLPGDSINRLAALFYPRNSYMQQRFVAKTLALNRKYQGTLNPARVYDESNFIVIPDLKYLSMQASPTKFRSVVATQPGRMLKVAHSPMPVGDNQFLAKIQVEYEILIQQNSILKQELAHLNEHLAGLQKTLEEMFVLASKILAQQPAVESAPDQVAQTPVISPIAEPQITPLETKPLETKPAPAVAEKMQPSAAKKIVNMTAENKKTASQPAPSSWSWETALSFKKQDALFPLILTLVALLTVILLIGSWAVSWYHNRSKQPEESDKPLSIPPAEIVGFAVTENGVNETPESVIARAGGLMANDKHSEAISLLEMYIRELPTHSVYPWLYLLEIRHKLGQKAEFDELVERLHNTFNVQPPAWEDRQSGVVIDSSLEDFPHIVTELERLWTSDDAVHYLTELQLDNRRGERTGFSVEVMKEITVLQKILETRGEYAAEPSHKPELRLVSSA